MSAKGYHLIKVGSFCNTYEVGVPAAMRYRIDITTSRELDRTKVEMYRECGWNYICTSGKSYSDYYRTTDENAVEMHTDPSVQADTLKTLKKNMMITSLLYFICLLCYLMIAVINLRSYEFICALGGYTEMNAQLAQMTLVVAYIYLTGLYILTLYKVSKLMKRMKQGVEINHCEEYNLSKYKCKTAITYIICALLILIILLPYVGMMISNASDTEHISLNGDTETVRYLGEIEEFEAGSFSSDVFGWMSEYYNSYSQERHLLAANLLKIYEGGTSLIENADVEDCTMTTEIYTTISSAFAKKYCDSIMKYDSLNSQFITTENITAASNVFDRMYLCRCSDGLRIYAYKGKTVVVVKYRGNIEADEFAASFARAYGAGITEK